MTRLRPVRVIAVSSGKGGVGKTNISVNLAVSLSGCGQSVMLLDGDLGLANVNVLLGLDPVHDLSHVLSGECELNDIVIEGPAGVKIVPAASGISGMADLSHAEHVGIIRAFSELEHMIDTLIVDTTSGVSGSVVSFCKASQEVIVVVCDEPTSIMDAFSFIWVMSRDHHVRSFRILVNMAKNERKGQELFNRMSSYADRDLDVTLSLLGVIPYDQHLRRAVQAQRAVVEAFPDSPSSCAFEKIVNRINSWPHTRRAGGQLEFFVDRLVALDTGQDSVMT